MSKHTPGPWFADQTGMIWRRNPAELYQNGGGVAGDKPLAAIYVGWFGEGKVGYPMMDNAKLIAAAPELLEALEEVSEFVDYLKEYNVPNDFPTDLPEKIKAAIAKARGE